MSGSMAKQAFWIALVVGTYVATTLALTTGAGPHSTSGGFALSVGR
jgi:hypothetical protein